MPPSNSKPEMKQLVGYDISLSCAASSDNYLHIVEKLKQIFRKWVFQMEKGTETGYLHWQIRGHLYSKVPLHVAIRDFNPSLWGSGRWSATCTTVHLGNNFNYVMKLDSPKLVPGPTRTPSPMSRVRCKRNGLTNL